MASEHTETRSGRSRRIALAAAVAGVGGLVLASALLARPVGLVSGRAAGSDLRIGMDANTQDYHERTSAIQRRVRALGPRWLRERLDWAELEPAPGRRRWARSDRLFAVSARNGMRVLPLLIGTPAWAGTPGSLPEDRAGFARFVARAAARYGPGGRFWRAHPGLDETLAPRMFEIWNEPYYRAFAASGVDPAAYARLFRDAARAGRAANRRTGYLIAAELGFSDEDGARRSWVEPMFDAVPDLRRWVGAIAVHPYGERSPAASAPGGAGEDFRRIATVRRQFAARGAARPLWITEVGWSTCEQRPPCVTLEQQARYVGQLLDVVRAPHSDVDAVFVYGLRDVGGDRDDKENWFGVLDPRERPKPAARALRHAIGRALG